MCVVVPQDLRKSRRSAGESAGANAGERECGRARMRASEAPARRGRPPALGALAADGTLGAGVGDGCGERIRGPSDRCECRHECRLESGRNVSQDDGRWTWREGPRARIRAGGDARAPSHSPLATRYSALGARHSPLFPDGFEICMAKVQKAVFLRSLRLVLLVAAMPRCVICGWVASAARPCAPCVSDGAAYLTAWAARRLAHLRQ
jgi:hypothetical protein